MNKVENHWESAGGHMEGMGRPWRWKMLVDGQTEPTRTLHESMLRAHLGARPQGSEDREVGLGEMQGL